MKVLSIKQPWAWGIVHGPKRVENRAWGTAYRGTLLIHASGTIADARSQAVRDWWRSIVVEQPEMPPAEDLVRGAIIGVGLLVACSRRVDDLDAAQGGGKRQIRFSEFGRTWWVLADVAPLTTPVPVPGRLGLWEPDAATEAAVLAAWPKGSEHLLGAGGYVRKAQATGRA